MEGPYACPVCGLVLMRTPKEVAQHFLRKAASGDEDHTAWLKTRVPVDRPTVDDLLSALDY